MQESKPKINNNVKVGCPNCHSINTWKCGFVYRRTGKVQIYQCKDCGFKFRSN